MTAVLLPLAYAMVFWAFAECIFRRPGLEERAWENLESVLLLLAALELAQRSVPELATFCQIVTTLRAMRLAGDAIWGSKCVDGVLARWVVAPCMSLVLLVAWIGLRGWQRPTNARGGR